MISLLAPLGLLAGLLTIPVVLMHVLAPVREGQPVSSLLLWRKAEQTISAAAPWQRLRWSWLLFLQLLAVLLFAFALARPAALVPSPLAEHTVFIVDASGSMAAVDGEPDRLAAAVDRVLELHADMPAAGRVSLVVASPTPSIVLRESTDGDALGRALRGVRTMPGPADFDSAFVMAESLISADRPTDFVLVSDGGLTELEQGLAPTGTRYEAVGSDDVNRAITGLSARRTALGVTARVTVTNTGGPSATQTVRFTLDGETVDRLELTIEEGSTAEAEVELPVGSRVSAFLEGEDLLPTDNHRYVVVPEAEELGVAVLGETTFFVDQLLEAMSATIVAPEAADVLVINGVDVPAGVSVPFLAIAPPGGAPGIEVTGTVEHPIPTLAVDEPLLDDVDISRLAIADGQQLVVSEGTVLVGAPGAPLIVSGAAGDVPFYYFSFAFERSNLPVEVAFPILGSRLIDDLISVDTLASGFTVGDRLPQSFRGELTDPRGGTQTVAEGYVPPVFDLAGLWWATNEDGERLPLAVNTDTGESRLAPLETLALPAGGDREISTTDSTLTARSILPWVLAAILVVLVVEALVGWRSARRVRGVQRWAAAVVRVAIVGLVVAAIIDPVFERQSDQVTTIFVIDASASMGATGVDGGLAFVTEAIDDHAGGGRSAVVTVDGDARVLRPLSEEAMGRFDLDLGDASDLERGVRLASTLLDGSTKQRIVLISDGRATTGDLGAEAQRLGRLGVPIDIVIPEVSLVRDAAVVDVAAPSSAQPDTVIDVQAEVVATEAGPATVTLRTTNSESSTSTELETRQVDLVTGSNIIDFSVAVSDAGVNRFTVDVDFGGDEVDANDAAHAAVDVAGPSTVLVVEGVVGNGSIVAEALEARGIGVEVVSALGSLDDLVAHQAVVLVDVHAEQLAETQIQALESFVRQLGRGLVVIGGDQSFGLGGYSETDLEALLPVQAEVDDLQREQSVAEVLVIDTSESMGACHCASEPTDGLAGDGNIDGPIMMEGEGPNKTDISRSAAARAIEALTQNDEVGVLAFNGNNDWVIPLQQLPSEQVVTEGLSQLQPLGETRIGPAMAEAAAALEESSKELRHIILFTDGFTSELAGAEAMLMGEGFEEDMDFSDSPLVIQAGELAERGITVSVVATGEGAIPELAAVAEAGNGRFYPGRDLNEIPEIFVREARLAARSFVNEGEYFPTVTGLSAATSGLSAAPSLSGFIATHAKPTADVQLEIGELADPLLASWRIGLGRVTTWSSDAGERWGANWAAWDGNAEFWSAVVRETFPLSGASGVRVDSEVVNGRLQLELQTAADLEAGSEVTAYVGGPDGTSSEIIMERQSDGTFAASVPALADGTYSVGVGIESPDGSTVAATALATRSYSAEFVPGPPAVDVLTNVAEVSSGRMRIEPGQAFDGEGLEAGIIERSLRWLFLLVAVLLWPLDVALRRLRFGRRDRRDSGDSGQSTPKVRRWTLAKA